MRTFLNSDPSVVRISPALNPSGVVTMTTSPADRLPVNPDDVRALRRVALEMGVPVETLVEAAVHHFLTKGTGWQRRKMLELRRDRGSPEWGGLPRVEDN